MKILVIILFLFSFLIAKDSFITKEEYAKMLYNEPRGINCAKCHGEVGEGKVIATFIDKGKLKSLRTTPIFHLTYVKFREGTKSSNIIMPKYYLTEEEIRTLYYYLQNVNSKKESK